MSKEGSVNLFAGIRQHLTAQTESTSGKRHLQRPVRGFGFEAEVSGMHSSNTTTRCMLTFNGSYVSAGWHHKISHNYNLCGVLILKITVKERIYDAFPFVGAFRKLAKSAY
jgi:hypothetical protein